MENKINYYFNFDMYATTTNFYFKNHDRVNTIFGTFLTAIYIIASLTLFIYYIIRTIQRKNFTVHDSTIYGQEMPFIDINSKNFYFAFGLEDPQTSNRFIDDSIYIPKIVFVDKAKINDELVTVYQKTLDYEICDVNKFGDNYQHLFIEGELSNSYCLKDFNYDLTFAGGYKYERFTFIRIRIYPCVNGTDNNDSCKPQEEIDKYMSSGYFSIILKDIGLNPSNYSLPVIPTLQDLYTTIDKKIYKNFILNLGVTEIHTDKGLFTEDIDIQKYLQFRKEQETFTFRDEEEYYEGKSVIIAQFKLDDNIFVQTRSYTKIPEIFSIIGGYMQLMNTAFLLLTIIVNKFNLELKVLNSIFRVNYKKKKIILKFQTLNDFEMINSQFNNSNSNTNVKYSFFNNNNTNSKKLNSVTRHVDLDNKSKNSLVKDNEIPNISILNISDNNKNEIEDRSRNTIFKINNRILPYEDSKIDQCAMPISRKQEIENSDINNKENGTNFNIFNIRKNFNEKSGYKDYNEKIKLNMLDYCCCNLLQHKKNRDIEIYNLANSFYRKKLDVVHVFNLLLFTEKHLLKNNSEYIYSLN